jgi:hypothetical protein
LGGWVNAPWNRPHQLAKSALTDARIRATRIATNRGAEVLKRSSSLPRAGSGTVITCGTIVALIALLCLGRLVGWDATWRAIGVTPLPPHFFDMHVPLDYAACALRGIDPYVPHACNVANFNLPPIWLWLGQLGLDGSDADWLAAAMIACAAAVMVTLFRGRSIVAGIVALIGILSPSVMMGVERANPDLLILALVGTAALLYHDQSKVRIFGSVALISIAFVLKLFPMFSVTLAARFNRRTIIFAAIVALLSLVYLAAIFHYLFLIRSNVPTTFILSYGYKAIFLGLDHLRSEAGLKPFGLADSRVPVVINMLVLLAAAAAALINLRRGHAPCLVSNGAAGTAFLFGSGIYCGTFLLGTNFIYRLMFLLLCLPQLLDWQGQKLHGTQWSLTSDTGLLTIILSALWANGNANGHTTFLLLPQLINWLLFFALTAVLISNFLNTALPHGTTAS